MKKSIFSPRREEGFTLIELIASLTLMAFVMGVLYSVVTFGMNSYYRVKAENVLRDEADVMMSSIMTELYTFGPTTITNISEDSIELKRADGTTHIIKAENGTLQIGPNTNEKPVETLSVLEQGTDGTKIMVQCPDTDKKTSRSCATGLVVIKLKLEREYREDKWRHLELDSKFGF